MQHLTNIQGRWLVAHVAGLALFPLLGMTIWWMLPPAAREPVSSVALIPYMPLYIALDAVLGSGQASSSSIARASRPPTARASTAY